MYFSLSLPAKKSTNMVHPSTLRSGGGVGGFRGCYGWPGWRGVADCGRWAEDRALLESNPSVAQPGGANSPPTGPKLGHVAASFRPRSLYRPADGPARQSAKLILPRSGSQSGSRGDSTRPKCGHQANDRNPGTCGGGNRGEAIGDTSSPGKSARAIWAWQIESGVSIVVHANAAHVSADSPRGRIPPAHH